MLHKDWRRLAFSLPALSFALLLLSLAVTFFAPKQIPWDAWGYHYYSGAMLLENRLDSDYFAASSQSYLNPLVHAPFAAMVHAHWPSVAVGFVLTCYSALALVLLAVFYRVSLHLRNEELLAALALSLLQLLVWWCMGSSFADLFLLCPVFLALIFLYQAQDTQKMRQTLASGFCFGVAFGLKFTAIIYAPGLALLLLLWVWRGTLRWNTLVLYPLAALLGLCASYGWWGWQLYRHFGNPFFPFFNHYFRYPYFPINTATHSRFVSWDVLAQAVLPFHMASTEPMVYVERLMPDLRPALFLTLLPLVFFIKYGLKRATYLRTTEQDFLLFVLLTLYTWVFTSGNGRYGMGVFLLLGAALFMVLRVLLPAKILWRAVLWFLLLQGAVVFSAVDFNFDRSNWKGEWFAMDFRDVASQNKQLILTSTSISYSVMLKDMGQGSTLMNLSGQFNMENNALIQAKVAAYNERIFGVSALSPDLLKDKTRLQTAFFDEFGRFGLALGDPAGCRLKHSTVEGILNNDLLFCQLKPDAFAIARYAEKTQWARHAAALLEPLCPEAFSPTQSSVRITGTHFVKRYDAGDIMLHLYRPEIAIAFNMTRPKLMASIDLRETQTLSKNTWREKYCLPLLR